MTGFVVDMQSIGSGRWYATRTEQFLVLIHAEQVRAKLIAR